MTSVRVRKSSVRFTRTIAVAIDMFGEHGKVGMSIHTNLAGTR